MFGVQRWKNSVLGGIFDRLCADAVEIVPTFFARALPSGMVERSAFETIRSEIVTGILKAGHIDGICLALHGSMSAEGVDDPEGELLYELRQRLHGKIIE